MFKVPTIGLFVYKEVTPNHIAVMYNGNISDVAGKRGKILGVIFIFNIYLQNVSYTCLYNGVIQ